nr:MAG TPA: hypothetical protein [Caudoviricetes sp.]
MKSGDLVNKCLQGLLLFIFLEVYKVWKNGKNKF